MDSGCLYLSISKNPASFEYKSVEGHFDEVMLVIKEDVEQVFGGEVSKENIINLKIQKYE